MHARAVHLVRLLLVAALAPALAGCAVQADEPLARGDVARGDPPETAPGPTWADAADATIRPGTMLVTQKRDCQSNFLFVRPDNGAVFLGTTAYCVRDLPIGSVATVGSDTDLAVLVYSSWQTMHELGETDDNALEYNDFALFHLDNAAALRANPALLDAPGPTGVAPGGAALGERVRAFARAPELPRETDWRDAVVAGHAGEWALLTYAPLPGTPGTLGGTVIAPDGAAVGVLVSLGVVPNPGANGVARLDTLLAYASGPGRIPLALATQTSS